MARVPATIGLISADIEEFQLLGASFYQGRGARWTKMTPETVPLLGAFTTAVAGINRTWIASNGSGDGAVSRTSGKTWQEATGVPDVTGLSGAIVAGGGRWLLLGIGNQIAVSNDAKSWTLRTINTVGAGTSWTHAHFVNGRWFLMGWDTQSEWIASSDARMVTWTASALESSFTNNHRTFVSPRQVSWTGSRYIYNCGRGVWTSADGLNWRRANGIPASLTTDREDNTFGQYVMRSVDEDLGQVAMYGDTVLTRRWALNRDKSMNVDSGLYRSTDSGLTFSKVETPWSWVPSYWEQFYLASHPQGFHAWYFSWPPRSMDDGWQEWGYPNAEVYVPARHPNGATYGELYTSEDGMNWTRVWDMVSGGAGLPADWLTGSYGTNRLPHFLPYGGFDHDQMTRVFPSAEYQFYPGNLCYAATLNEFTSVLDISNVSAMGDNGSAKAPYTIKAGDGDGLTRFHSGGRHAL